MNITKSKREQTFVTRWMFLVGIVLSEISQTERQILHDLIHMCSLTRLNTLKQRAEWWLPGEAGRCW